MGITEEQRRRIEANRLAVLERRKRFAEAAAAAAGASEGGGGTDAPVAWRLAKCPRFAPPPPTLPPPPPPPPPPPQPPVGFKVVVEVCSPEDFSVAVGPAEGVAYPGEAECLGVVQDWDASGLLKGGSKRRVTPLCDVSNPLPENAEWRKGFCIMARLEREYTQGWTVHDEPLCKLCQGPCNGKLAKSPEYFEDLFCGLTCFEVYKSRTSGRFCRLDKLVHEPSEDNAWHADHIVPVYKGGECTLENLRTL